LTTEEIITKILDAISLSYPGRFEATTEMIRIWQGILGDLEAIAVRTAVLDLVSRSKYPPCVAEVREVAVSLSSGTLAPPTGYEAWERIQGLCDGSGRIQLEDLSEDERRALKFIGGTTAVKTSKSISYDRRDFIAAYESFVAKRRIETSALPAVASLAESNAPVPQLPLSHTGPICSTSKTDLATPAQVKELLNEIDGYRIEYEPPGEIFEPGALRKRKT
jgi:hypothetical protein